MNNNPYIIDNNGDKVYYQRGLVWNLEQKQALIHSIYQGIEIGKIVVRERSFQYVENEVKLGNKVGFKDVVDGKQRLNALLDFVMDKFPDEYGNYFSELSDKAQHSFYSSLNVTYCELSEDVSDKDVIDMFLNVNIAGVKIDKDHIDFVKSIEI